MTPYPVAPPPLTGGAGGRIKKAAERSPLCRFLLVRHGRSRRADVFYFLLWTSWAFPFATPSGARHAACRSTERSRFFRSPRHGRRCAVASRFAFSNAQTFFSATAIKKEGPAKQPFPSFCFARLERIRMEIVPNFHADAALTLRKKRGFSVCSVAGSRSRDYQSDPHFPCGIALEHFQFEPRCDSNHTACRFAEDT